MQCITPSAMAGFLLNNQQSAGQAEDAEDGLETLPSSCGDRWSIAESAAVNVKLVMQAVD